MLNDTLTTIENQFFDGLEAVQEPTLDAARKLAELVGQLPYSDSAAAVTAKLPSAEEILARNFGFAQRLLDIQKSFALELAGIVAEPAKATTKAAKKAA